MCNFSRSPDVVSWADVFVSRRTHEIAGLVTSAPKSINGTFMMTRDFGRSRLAMFVILLGVAGCNNNSAKDQSASAGQATSGSAQSSGPDRPGDPGGGPGGPGNFGGPDGRGPGPGRRSIDWAAKVAAADKSKLPPPAETKDLAFEKDIRPLFEATCFRCHGSERARGNLHLTTLEGVVQGGEHGKAVIAGNSGDSPLVIAISQIDTELAMPPTRGPGSPRGPGGGGGPGGPGGGPEGPGGPDGRGGPNGPGVPPGGFGQPAKALTAEQVGLVRAWIDQGAK
jgi:hypothetical protein